MISVIVPMYNTEPFLENCVNSILKNTYKDYELLLINDGSNDNTLQVAYELEKKDKRIRVIDKEHVGVGHTRNRGIDEAKGEYIAFIDADDEVRPNYFERLYTTMVEDNLDWVMCNQDHVGVDENSFQAKTQPAFKEKTILEGDNLSILYDTIFINQRENLKKDEGAWNLPNNVMSLIKKKIIDDNHLRINEKTIYGEDLLFNCELAKHIKRFGYIPEKLYVVHIREKSSRGNMFLKGDGKPLFDLLDEVTKISTQSGGDFSRAQIRYINSQLAIFIDAIANLIHINKGQKYVREFRKEMKNRLFYQKIKDNFSHYSNMLKEPDRKLLKLNFSPLIYALYLKFKLKFIKQDILNRLNIV